MSNAWLACGFGTGRGSNAQGMGERGRARVAALNRTLALHFWAFSPALPVPPVASLPLYVLDLSFSMLRPTSQSHSDLILTLLVFGPCKSSCSSLYSARPL